jgi:hypothetical protein
MCEVGTDCQRSPAEKSREINKTTKPLRPHLISFEKAVDKRSAMFRSARFGFRASMAASMAAGAAALSLGAKSAQLAASNPFSSIKLNYFPIQGPAEPARLALVLGGIPFEVLTSLHSPSLHTLHSHFPPHHPFTQDARHDRATMNAMKEAGELPYGQLPTLVVDGQTIAQSVSGDWPI